jgi:hypothetical protein
MIDIPDTIYQTFTDNDRQQNFLFVMGYETGKTVPIPSPAGYIDDDPTVIWPPQSAYAKWRLVVNLHLEPAVINGCVMSGNVGHNMAVIARANYVWVKDPTSPHNPQPAS